MSNEIQSTQPEALTDTYIRRAANMTWSERDDGRDRVTLSEPEFGRAVRRVLSAMGGALAQQSQDDATRLAAWIEVACQSGDWLPDAYGMPRMSASKTKQAENQAPEGGPLTELVQRLRGGGWDLRAPQEMADMIADQIELAALAATPQQPAQAPREWPTEEQPDGSRTAVQPEDMTAEQRAVYGYREPAQAPVLSEEQIEKMLNDFASAWVLGGVDERKAAGQALRAALLSTNPKNEPASEPQPKGTPAGWVPEGFRLFAANEGLIPLMDALDRAHRKGYMPDAIIDEYEGFDWRAEPRNVEPEPDCFVKCQASEAECHAYGCRMLRAADEAAVPSPAVAHEPAASDRDARIRDLDKRVKNQRREINALISDRDAGLKRFGRSFEVWFDGARATLEQPDLKTATDYASTLYDSGKTTEVFEVTRRCVSWHNKFGMGAAIESEQAERDRDARDAARIQFLEDETNAGSAPNLVFDDDGHWAVSYSGMQPLPRGDGQGFDETVGIHVIVEPEEWRPSIREAIDAAMSAAAKEAK